MNSATNQSIENTKDKMIRQNEKKMKHEMQKEQTDSAVMKGIRDMQIRHNEKVIYKKGQDLAAQRADLSDRIESNQAVPDIEHNTSRLQPKVDLVDRPQEGCGCGENGGVSAEDGTAGYRADYYAYSCEQKVQSQNAPDEESHLKAQKEFKGF